jgi:dihydroxyacetone kinase
VLYVYGNYGGDTMNFDLAAELAGAASVARAGYQKEQEVTPMLVAVWSLSS